MKHMNSSRTAPCHPNPFRTAHRVDWAAHPEAAFICSAGETGTTCRLEAVFCLSVPGGLEDLHRFEAHADTWTASAECLIAGFPAGPRRRDRSGAWMRAQEHDGFVTIEFVPRGRTLLTYGGGDGFVGHLADNPATYSGARYWWEHVSNTFGVRTGTPTTGRCAHIAGPTQPTRVSTITTAVLIAGTVLCGLALLLS